MSEETKNADAAVPAQCQDHTCTLIIETLVAATPDSEWEDAE